MLFRTKPFLRSYAVIILLLFTTKGISQCNNWNTTANLTLASTCAANGSFNVKISGPDSANLTSIQYGIPVSASGYTVPLNSSPVFSGVPAGTYTVSTVATCSGTLVGKNTTITVPGNYTPPSMNLSLVRGSISCGAYGQINVYTINGAAPFNVRILSAPASYSGPASFTDSGTYYTISSLPAGSYTVQVTDACGSGTAPATVTVSSLSVSTLPLSFYGIGNLGCNKIRIYNPSISAYSSDWNPYDYDTLFKVSVQISGLVSATAFHNFNDTAFVVTLPAGKSIQDCYGKTITYTIQPPCGASFTATQTIGYPYAYIYTDQNCNKNFTASIYLNGPICYPVSYTFTDMAGHTYGPYTSGSSFTSPTLAIGSYTASITTGDGYTFGSSFGTSLITSNPYSVRYYSNGSGRNKYIDSFVFNTTAFSLVNKTVELFTGPTGYSFLGTWNGGGSYSAEQNMTPSFGKLLFPAGTYVWKITDSCGSYLLPITVPDTDLYEFTAGVDHRQRTCNGMQIWLKGTAKKNGRSFPVKFSLLLNGNLYFESGVWRQYASGTAINISTPGVYTILPSAAGFTYFNYFTGYPNPYTVTDTFVYTGETVQVDINNTQGFICKSGLPGSAKIYASGKNGIPFAIPTKHYQYALAHYGKGVSGPYLASDTSGIFTGFGGSANDTFDVKVTDSCGAFSVQAIKILDLGLARLISSSSYVACNGGNVQLHAIYLPDATYAWTGPGGFSSTLRDPVISNVSAANTGVYHLTVTTTLCSQSSTDSTTLIMAANPPLPSVNVNCDSPVRLTISSPSAGYRYTWLDSIYYDNVFYYIIVSPNTSTNTLIVRTPGRYSVIAIDTTTGCQSQSSSVAFADDPADKWEATIYSPHLKVCTGDTTILVANGPLSGYMGASYQWFKNGTVIPGATSYTYTTATTGDYSVAIRTDICTSDTSDPVTVTVVPIPAATISSVTRDICEGDTVLLHANTGTGYSYTWHYNDSTIPDAGNADVYVTKGGRYYVTVSNNGCARSSSTDTITTHIKPAPHILPDSQQELCPGSTLVFRTTKDTSYTYNWYRDGALLPGANASNYSAGMAGVYSVNVSSRYCAAVISNEVRIVILANTLSLGSDTVICKEGPFAINYSVDTTFRIVQWSDGSTNKSIVVRTPGKWWVAATNACGTLRDTVNVVSASSFLPHLPADTLICNPGNAAVFSVPAALQHISWSTGDTSAAIVVTKPGVYWVKGSFVCGTVYDTTTVHFCAPVIDNLLTTDSICAGSCIHFDAMVSNYPQQFTWSFVGATPDYFSGPTPPLICYNVPGDYKATLTVTNAGGTADASVMIHVFPQPVGRFSDTALQTPYDTVVLLPACTEANTVTWYKGDSVICNNCPVLHLQAKYWSAKYYCIVSNGQCSDTCTYTVHATDIPSDIWLPDAFSPNGDGRNDYFHVVTDNPNINVMELSIYNRWGQRLFVAMRSNKGWDGTVSGVPAEVGTYFYYLRYMVTGSDEVHYMKGDLTLIR